MLRVREGGLAYWRAWSIVLPTMFVSFLGLLAFGVGFLVTSVWSWQVAAFCFASVFTQRLDLDTGSAVSIGNDASEPSRTSGARTTR